MTPLPATPYIPSLDRFLSGQESPISWKSVYSVITNSRNIGDSRCVEEFLQNQNVTNILSKPYNAFTTPTDQTKAEFETKTSAINILPSSDSQFDLKEIKLDVLWLSKEANLDEVTALRIVLLECQFRRASQLLGKFSEEETVNIQEATGNNKLSNSISCSLLPQGFQLANIREDFEKMESRRLRILQTFLSEKRFLWNCTEYMLHLFFINSDETEEEINTNKMEPKFAPWLVDRVKAFAQSLHSINVETLILEYIHAIQDCIKSFRSESCFSKENGYYDDLEEDWIQTQITVAISNLKIVWYFLLYTVEFPSSQFVLEWFRILQSNEFFNQFSSGHMDFQVLVVQLQALSAVISVGMLEDLDPLLNVNHQNNPHPVSPELAADKPFIFNPTSILTLHSIILQAADFGFITAGPAIVAWSTFLQTLFLRLDAEKEMRFIEDDEPSNSGQLREASESQCNFLPYQSTFESIQATVDDDDAVDYLARRAVNVCHVFDTISALSCHLGTNSHALFPELIGSQIRNTFLGLIRKCVCVGYIPEIVCATISVLTAGCGYWELVNSTPAKPHNDPVVKFMNDSDLVEAFLKTSQSRFPYEPLPFLQFLRALASSSLYIMPESPNSILRYLDVVPVFTHSLPLDFADYETTLEEDNNNNVLLKRSINLFEPRFRNHGIIESDNKSSAMVRADKEFVISVGTPGRIISESGPRVACWFHQYSALKYFGKLLETYLAASDQVDGITGMPADPEVVGEIIEVLALLIYSFGQSSSVNQSGDENANQILEIASSGLNRNRDIITVIIEIFEEGLHYYSSRSGLDFPLQILISCVHFIHAILPLFPSRVWPIIARSGLLGVSKTGESLSTIVESVERPSGRFDFLISCTYLFESLLDDLVANTLRRKINSKSSAIFSGVRNIATGSPDQFITKIMFSFSKYLIDVLENSCSWKYQNDNDRQCLCRIITACFDRILQYCYGIESPTNSTLSIGMKIRQMGEENHHHLMSVLLPSASHLVESFLSISSGNLRFQPLLRSYLDGLDSLERKSVLQQSKSESKYVVSSLSFSRTLLRVGALLERPASQLEKLLFNASPLIARLFCSNDLFSIPVINLLESLVHTATSHEQEPPSLLGHLGPHTARNFLQVLSNLDKPLSRSNNLCSIWNFLGTVVSGRQQWFSNYLLTGKTPRDALKYKSSGEEMTMLDQPLLTTAFQKFTKINEVSIVESLAIIEFIALAQNFWPWTVCSSSKYPEFIKLTLDYVGNLPPPQTRNQGDLEEIVKTCHQVKMAASIADILAMHIFHFRQTGNSVSIKDLLPNLTYYERFGTSALSYNASLHGLLKQNFETRYSGCSGRDFKRTPLSSRSFGKQYFYDLQLADKMLRLDKAWTGRNGDDGMRAEFERANVNLSLVDAQIALFQSWKLLSLELSSWIITAPELHKLVSLVIINCLTVNSKPQPPEEIFSRLSQTRAELALVLTQRLLQTRSAGKEMCGLLRVVWMTICELRGNFERPVPDSDALYYRFLLKILYLTICVHSEEKLAKEEDLGKSHGLSVNQSVVPVIIEITKNIISRGLREIVTSIHEPTAESSPEDLALITGILQSSLRHPGISANYSQISSILISDGTPSIAMRLFSWSDRLAIDGDPIYGELSILFLLEVSSIPIMAEQLAIEGFLTQIASAGIMSYLQRDIFCQANDVGSRRCFNIWTRGILPLLLNILDSVKQSIAIEVAQFLNQFPALLRQSEKYLEAPVMNRLPDNGPKKYITLAACSGVHSLALVIFILNGFRESLKGSVDIPPVKWDSSTVLENVEFWLSSRTMLRERLLPTSEREIEMTRVDENKEAVSLLERKVISQLVEISNILGDNHIRRFSFGAFESIGHMDDVDGRNTLESIKTRRN